MSQPGMRRGDQTVKVVLFSGGRGSRVLSSELVRHPRVELTLAVNGYDDGLSTGCIAAVSVALIAGGIALAYADRHLVPGSGWDFGSVVEEAALMAIPAVGFVLASRRPANRVGWIILGAGLVLGVGFVCERYGQRGRLSSGWLT